MAIEFDDIKTEWGAFYEDNGQNVQDIKDQLKQPDETSELFPLGFLKGDSTVGKSVHSKTTRVLQPFQKKFTPLGGSQFKPREIALFRQKIDLVEYPDELHDSWMAFLTSNNLDRTTWPFVKWLAKHAIDQSVEDREKLEIFQGEWVEPTDGVPGPAGTTMDGIRKLVRTAYATGETGLIVPPGAFPATNGVNFCTYVENFVKAIPALVRREGGTLVMATELAELYYEGKDDKYNGNYSRDTNFNQVRFNPKITVKGVASHSGSQLIWLTPNWNKNRYVKAPENAKVFKIESEDRQVKLFTDFWFGLGFHFYEYLYHNDQDLV